MISMQHLYSELSPQDEFHAVYNTYSNIYATYGEKSIQVKKPNAKLHDLVSTIFIRDLTQVTAFKWDSIGGKYLTVFLKDGSIRINDMLQDGKLVAFIRTQTSDIDAALWDRFMEDERACQPVPFLFNHDILKLLPQLVRYSVTNGSEHPNMTPFTPQDVVWRQSKKPIIDIHLLHQYSADTFVIVVNGHYILNLGVSALTNNICKMLSFKKGVYRCYYQNGYTKEIDIEKFISNESKTMTLIEIHGLMTHYMKYIKEHITLVRKKLILPYLTFIDKLTDPVVCPVNLYDCFMSYIFEGEASQDFYDWMSQTVGQKNMEMIKELINQAYKATCQVLMMCILPVIERLIILTNKLQSILLSLQLIEQGSIANLEDVSIVETKTMIAAFQNLLKLTVEKIKIITHENDTLKTFLIWLDDQVMSLILETHIENIDINSNSKYMFQIVDGFDIFFKRNAEYDVLESTKYTDCIQHCDKLLEEINDLYIKDRLLGRIELGPFIPLFSELYESVSMKLLDVSIAELDQKPAVVYILKLLQGEKSKIKLGILDENDHRIKKDVTIPYGNIDNVVDVHITKYVHEAGNNLLSRNVIRINTQYADGSYKFSICNILKEPLSPFKKEGIHTHKPITSVAEMQLSFGLLVL